MRNPERVSLRPLLGGLILLLALMAIIMFKDVIFLFKR